MVGTYILMLRHVDALKRWTVVAASAKMTVIFSHDSIVRASIFAPACNIFDERAES